MPPASPGAQRSPHSRHARRADAVFTCTLWIAVAVTIGILLFIVVYIVFRGLVSDTVIDSPFVGAEAAALSVTGGGDIVIVVNRGVRISSLTAEDLQGIFSGDVTTWGDLSGQDISPAVFLLHKPESFEMIRRTLLGGASSWARNAVSLPSPTAVLQKVAETDGAIGWVDVADFPSQGVRGTRAVTVRELVPLVNPSVLALNEGRRLSSVTDLQMRSLLRGLVSNWREVGGPDLPVRLVIPAPTASTSGAVARFLCESAWTPAGATRVDDPAALKDTVLATPGSLAVSAWKDVSSVHDNFLSVRTRAVKRNLTLAYLFEEPRRAGKVGGVSTIILNTVLMILLTLLFTTPIGVGAALYLTEYARQGRLVAILRFGTDTLAGIPSIIFGLFGFIVFVTILHLGIGLISGTLTITIMLLPTIIRTSEEAIRSVPVSLREGSLALGATKWQTTTRVVVRAAVPGILTGVILAVGRAVGETAALLFTMGTDYRLVQGLRSSARVLSVHLFYLLKEGISFDKAFATGTILVIIVLIVNLLTTRLIGKMNLMRDSGGRNGRTA